jgi:putative alpha-1,2-mannosidase
MLNGETLEKTYIRHQDIVNGGELSFQMSSQPNYKWGVAPENRPRSALRTLTGTTN